jgi:hypothetical protein
LFFFQTFQVLIGGELFGPMLFSIHSFIHSLTNIKI